MFNAGSRRRSPGRAIAAVLVVGLLSGLMIGRNTLAAEPQSESNSKPAVTRTQVQAATAGLANLESAFMTIAEKLEPSVVSIRVNRTVRPVQNAPDIEDLFGQFRGFGGQNPFRNMPRQYRVNGAGSGVIVRPDGWILTNDHVVDGADKVTVKLSDGRELEGTVRRNFRSDLALIKVNASGLQAVEFGDSEKVRVGQWAIAFGSPFELDNTMTVGIISARSRQQTIGGGRNTGRLYPSLLQTDAAINPGNSGGALVDIQGRLIGVNVAIESPNGGNVGIGFAIPVNTARGIMDQLIAKGKVTRGYLGLVPRALTFEEKQKSAVTEGALIESVSEASPASRAGFEPGDVVVRFNGRKVADDVAFREMVATATPGARIEMVVRRNGREQTLNATLDAAPDPQAVAERPNTPAENMVAKLGLRVETVTPELEKRYDLGGGPAGAVVVEVEPGSPGQEAGIQPGDVIIRANGKGVASADDVNALSRNLKSGDTVALIVFRDKNRTLVNVRIP